MPGMEAEGAAFDAVEEDTGDERRWWPAPLSEEEVALRRRAGRLLESLNELGRMLCDSKAWENEHETVFANFRRGCLDGANSGTLEAPIYSNAQIEEAWLFLLKMRSRHPNRRKLIAECTTVCGASYNWSMVLHGSRKLRSALRATPEALVREVLGDAGALEIMPALAALPDSGQLLAWAASEESDFGGASGTETPAVGALWPAVPAPPGAPTPPGGRSKTWPEEIPNSGWTQGSAGSWPQAPTTPGGGANASGGRGGAWPSAPDAVWPPAPDAWPGREAKGGSGGSGNRSAAVPQAEGPGKAVRSNPFQTASAGERKPPTPPTLASPRQAPGSPGQQLLRASLGFEGEPASAAGGPGGAKPAAAGWGGAQWPTDLTAQAPAGGRPLPEHNPFANMAQSNPFRSQPGTPAAPGFSKLAAPISWSSATPSHERSQSQGPAAARGRSREARMDLDFRPDFGAVGARASGAVNGFQAQAQGLGQRSREQASAAAGKAQATASQAQARASRQMEAAQADVAKHAVQAGIKQAMSGGNPQQVQAAAARGAVRGAGQVAGQAVSNAAANGRRAAAAAF